MIRAKSSAATPSVAATISSSRSTMISSPTPSKTSDCIYPLSKFQRLMVPSRATMGTEEQSILIVDDDRGLLRLIENALRREGFLTAVADSGKAALDWLAVHKADLMLLDLKLEDIEGRELIERIKQAERCPPFIVITGQGDERVAVDTRKRG